MHRTIVGLIVILALGILSAPPPSNARQPSKVARIVHLRAISPLADYLEAFRQGLHEFGWIEGQNIVIESRYAESIAQLPDLAAELVRQQVDIILTAGTPAALAAKQATNTIPIVMTEIGLDPIDAGLVTSLARPEGNVTGVAALGAELWGKRLELFRQAVPRLSRLAVLWNPANPGNLFCVRAIQAVALALGVQLQPLEVQDANAFEHAFAEIAKEPPDAVTTCWDTLTLAHAKPIADFAMRSRLPTLAPLREYAQAGVLMAFATSIPGQYRRAAYYVDKLLKGTTPADLPVERPMQFELVINLKTAQALGLTLHPTLLFQANELIR